MRNIYLSVSIIILLGVVSFVYYTSRPDDSSNQNIQNIFGDMFTLHQYTKGNKPSGYGLLYTQFTVEHEDTLTAYIDFDHNGTFDDTEKVATNVPVQTRADWMSGVPVALSTIVADRTPVKIILGSGESIEATLMVSSEEQDELLDLKSVTNSEESMKGLSRVAYAQGEPVTNTFRPGVPDITQRISECAPTAAANSILSLAQEHGKSLDELPSPTEIIDGLKQNMDWTPENGVLPNEFVQGKNEWAIQHGLPIRTTKVGDKNGLSTLTQLLDAMNNGAATELRITFGDPTTGKATGGHMVTVVGIRTEGGQTFIEINDPKTPEGTETYEINANVIEGYPYDGLAVLSWGFVQVWDEQAPTNLAPMSEVEVQGIKNAVGIKGKIKVIVFRNKYVPLASVHVGKGPECDGEPHYHANTGSVTALDGTVFTDPDGCGYGKVKEVPVEEVQVN